MGFSRRMVGAAAAIGLGAAAGMAWINSAPSRVDEGLLEIPAGAGAARVARELKDRGRLRSATWFRLLSRLSRADGRLKAGVYRLAPGRSAAGILKDLVAGRGEAVRLTWPEGWALWQMADRVAAAGVCGREAFLSAAQGSEGFLFPETYLFEPGAPASDVVRTARDRFGSVWEEVFRAAQAAGVVPPGPVPRDPDEEFRLADGRRWTQRRTVILASLVEREARRPSDRPLVAAVYHNRLKKGMRLECDPTVQYALGEWKNPLWKKDLALEHPYNTYRRFGLPPGPICSPGRDALAAALAPAAVDYLYFVADDTGGHSFSSNYEDHQRAVRARRRAMRAVKKS